MHGPDGPLGLIPSLPRQVLLRSDVAARFSTSRLPAPCAARYAVQLEPSTVISHLQAHLELGIGCLLGDRKQRRVRLLLLG
eukprot:10050456-Heterocapsa_arctica.AAC.1